MTDARELAHFISSGDIPALNAEAMCLKSRLYSFQPLDSRKLPSPCVWRWTPRMRSLPLTQRGAQGSSLGCPVKVHREGGAATWVIFREDPDAGKGQDSLSPQGPHQEDFREAGQQCG